MASERIDFAERVFDIKSEPMPKGSWWWWFWLFFFDNPVNPEKPRQLMILWSTKNEKSIDCNGVRMLLGPQTDRSRMDGAVASWYFDGEEMHHDFLLDPCRLNVSEGSLTTEGKPPTSFAVSGGKSRVRIGDDFEFVANMAGSHDFSRPDYHSNRVMMNMDYRLLRVNRFALSGRVGGRPIKGTAYFQRVFVNAPSAGWYWGIFHFGGGGILTYFNPRVLGKSIKKDIALFDGKSVHRFRDISVRRRGTELPDFVVSGENQDERISFTVKTYAHSSWTFRKRSFGFVPGRLVYREYPATISDLTVLDKKAGKATKLGKAVGNAEHTTGFLP